MIIIFVKKAPKGGLFLVAYIDYFATLTVTTFWVIFE